MRKLLILLTIVIFSIDSLAQSKRTITGSILDSEGLGLPGAAVVEKGTKNGVTADVDGKYSIEVDRNKTVILEYSFIGMKNVLKQVAPSIGVVNVTLENDTNLNEAVIVGAYGLVHNRENLTGSAFEVKSDVIAKLPANRMDNLLAGLVPGLAVKESTTGGRTSYKIRIRGDGSLSASCEPLWIVDGVPVYTGTRTNSVTGTSYTVSPLSFLNNDDIESMVVLRDATTTVLYGADGANGVILVTTKNGSKGIPKVSATVRYGLSSIDRSTTKKLADADLWRTLAEEAWTNSGRPLKAFPFQDNEHNSYSTTNTDWYDVYTRTGSNTQINVSANGGTDRLKNYMSLAYLKSNSTYIKNTQEKYSIMEKSTYSLTDTFNVTAGITAGYNHNNIGYRTSRFDELLPIFEPYNADGSYRLYNYYSTSDTEYIPVAKKFVYNYIPDLELNDNYQNTLDARANLDLTWKPVKGLSLSSNTGFDYQSIYEATYSSKKLSYDSSENSGSSRRSGVFNTIFIENLKAIYNRTFDDIHHVNLMASAEWKNSKHPYVYATGSGFVNDYIKEVTYANKETISGASNVSQSKSLSYIAFAEYGYKGRYTANISARRQGNSAFSVYSKWSNFAALGFNWNIRKEPFFNIDAINILNAKFSYGLNGNSRVDSASAYGKYGLSSTYGGITGATQTSPANPDLSWEMIRTINGGLNIGFFDRIEIQLEGYERRTFDMIYSGRVSSVIAEGTVPRNVGEIANIGLEFNIETTNIKRNDFKWTTQWNGARNFNKIIKLADGMHTGFFDYVWMEGASKDAWWLVRWAGVDPTTGAPMWYDINGDLTYNFTYDNRVLLPEYSNQPTLKGGMTNTFTWKNFSLSFLLDYTFGGYELISLLDDGVNALEDNMPIESVDHWRKPGDTSVNPAYIHDNPSMSYMSSTRDLYKMNNILLRNLSFTYGVPQRFSKMLGMKHMSLSIMGDNLYLWTPNQSRKHNSYKTLCYSEGMTRMVYGCISMDF
ncbi:MAG: SusC/RagA family TonB-linked outer membrane protein [Bacteroidales bacterium]|nr:SusC/RagA family TonB-linked outer membrane protein [Candidatus Cryptobacteroides faecihippi]